MRVSRTSAIHRGLSSVLMYSAMSSMRLAYILLAVAIVTRDHSSSASDPEEEDRYCELLQSSELIVTSSHTSSSSSSSSSTTTAAAAAGDRVSVNTTVLVACRNSSLVLSGAAHLTCQQDGSWDHAVPTCLRNGSQPERSPVCPTPAQESFVNGQIILAFDSLSVKYRCNDGFRLDGAEQRHCLANNTWSAPVPRCVARGDSEPTWSAAFKENVEWRGLYDYDGQSVQFTFVVSSASEDVVKATLQDRITQLQLQGRQQNDYIVFNTTRVVQQSSTLTTLTDWSVAGPLTKVGGHWVYTGIVSCSQPGFYKLVMSPSSSAPGTDETGDSMSEQLSATSLDDYDYGDVPSSTALALGVTIAIVAIVIAGGLAAFCAHRGASLRSSAHQTLTSFENPIYDAEHVVVK